MKIIKSSVNPESINDLKIVLVIVTYNAEKFISELLRSILTQDYDLSKVLIVIVDNASRDKTIQKAFSLLRETKRTHYIVIKLDNNLGFALGNNIAFKLLEKLHDSSISDKIFVLLNPDAKIIRRNYLRATEVLTNRFPVIGFAMLSGRNDVIDSLGAFIDFFGGPTDILCCAKLSSTMKRIYELLPKLYPVPGVCFAAVAIHGDVLERLGFLKSEYVMYFEDTEWCLRAWSKGVPVVVYKDFMVWHARGGTQRSPTDSFGAERFGSVELDIPVHYAKNSLLLAYEYLGVLKFIARLLLYLLTSLALRRKYLVYASLEALRIIVRKRIKLKRLPKGLIIFNPRTWTLLWTLKCILQMPSSISKDLKKCIAYGAQRASLEYLRYRFLSKVPSRRT